MQCRCGGAEESLLLETSFSFWVPAAALSYNIWGCVVAALSPVKRLTWLCYVELCYAPMKEQTLCPKTRGCHVGTVRTCPNPPLTNWKVLVWSVNQTTPTSDQSCCLSGQTKATDSDYTLVESFAQWVYTKRIFSATNYHLFSRTYVFKGPWWWFTAVDLFTLMILLRRGAAFTDSRRIVSVSWPPPGRMTPLRRPRDALGGMHSGAPSLHSPSPYPSRSDMSMRRTSRF